MLTFTQIPPDNSPLGQRAEYTVTSDTAATLDIRITDAGDNTLLGTKRLVGVTRATFDAAPYLRRTVRFSPTAPGTGFREPANRIRKVKISAEPTGNTAGRVTTPIRTFIPAASPATAPALLTTMPVNRLIASGESDELTLLSGSALTVTITTDTDGEQQSRSYTSGQAGFGLFRVDTADFPGAEKLTVDAGACGKVVYTLIAQPEDARRLAWRSSAGSLEHYTFPIERSETLGVEKVRAYGAEGHTASAVKVERRTVLTSAFETREVLEALAGIISSPEVWLVEGGVSTPVDVITETAVTLRRGVMSCLEIEVRDKQRPVQPWN